MNTEIKISPEELREQANRLTMLSCRMQDVSNKAKATMQSMAISVTPDFACNLDWKGNMLASKLDVLANGLQYGGTRATFAANALEEADKNAGKDNCSTLERLSADNIDERGEGFMHNVIGNALDEVLKDSGAGLTYKLFIDIAKGELDADSGFSVLDALAGNSPSARFFTETLESLHDHTMDYAKFYTETVSDWQNGDYIDAIYRETGRMTTQFGLTILDAGGSTILGFTDSIKVWPGVTIGDVSELLLGDSFSGMWDKGIENVREFTQDAIDKGGEILQDCFDNTVNAVKDTMDDIGDGINDVCKGLGSFFGL